MRGENKHVVVSQLGDLSCLVQEPHSNDFSLLDRVFVWTMGHDNFKILPWNIEKSKALSSQL